MNPDLMIEKINLLKRENELVGKICDRYKSLYEFKSWEAYCYKLEIEVLKKDLEKKTVFVEMIK